MVLPRITLNPARQGLPAPLCRQEPRYLEVKEFSQGHRAHECWSRRVLPKPSYAAMGIATTVDKWQRFICARRGSVDALGLLPGPKALGTNRLRDAR